jgi:hypothetical protein
MWCVPAQALTCLQASSAAAPDGGAPDAKPRRSTNYAPPTSSGAAADAASEPAADSAAAADGAQAHAAGGARAGRAAASGRKPGNVQKYENSQDAHTANADGGHVRIDGLSLHPARSDTQGAIVYPAVKVTCCPNFAAGEPVEASEVVLTVALAHPANAQQTSQQWRVLGSQRLTVLRDRLYCRSDLDMRGAGLSVPSGANFSEDDPSTWRVRGSASPSSLEVLPALLSTSIHTPLGRDLDQPSTS